MQTRPAWRTWRVGWYERGDGITGTVTEVAPTLHHQDRWGETYTIHFSANTRIMKQTARQRGEGGGNPPQTLKSTDIKVAMQWPRSVK